MNQPRSRYTVKVTKPAGPKPEKKRTLLSALAGALFVIGVYAIGWPELLPFQMFGDLFLGSDNSILGAVVQVWPMFAWGAGSTLILYLLRTPTARLLMDTPSEIFAGGTFVSFRAGIVEEICFRWVLFLGAIGSLVFSNWLLSGVLGFCFVCLFALLATLAVLKWNVLAGILTGLGSLVLVFFLLYYGGPTDFVAWVYTNIMCPIADFTSLGYMHEYLYHPWSWAVGAAIITTNTFFRDGHAYQGWLGFINSWFLGLVFFALLFQYGLLTCIVVHILYDLVVFYTLGLMRFLRP